MNHLPQKKEQVLVRHRHIPFPPNPQQPPPPHLPPLLQPLPPPQEGKEEKHLQQRGVKLNRMRVVELLQRAVCRLLKVRVRLLQRVERQHLLKAKLHLKLRREKHQPKVNEDYF